MKVTLLFCLLLVTVVLCQRGRGGGNNRGGGGGGNNRDVQTGGSNRGGGNNSGNSGGGGGKQRKGTLGGKDRKDVEKVNKRVKQRRNVDWGSKKSSWKKAQKSKPKKRNKNEQVRQADKFMWKGKVVNLDRKKEKVPRKQAVKTRNPCVAQGKSLPDLGGQPSKGPAGDGVDPSVFEVCDKRKRGGKGRGRGRARVKRSESYASTEGLWDEPSSIPFYYDPTWPASNKANVKAAIDMWERYTCLKFQEIPIPSESAPYMHIDGSGQACGTEVIGPNNEAKATKLYGNLCRSQNGTLCHEIGHVLGLTHSHKRSDRAGFVNIIDNNIISEYIPQFELNDYDKFGAYGVPYYFDSIMHYQPLAFAKQDSVKTTICPLDPLMELVMGQREEPAFGDIALVNRMYCQVSCYNANEMTNVKLVKGHLSQTISGRKCQNWNAQTPHAHGYTYKGDDNTCRNDENWGGGPWCFTTDPNVLYEPCMSTCEALEAAGIPYCHGYCHNGGYHDPTSCTCICPVGYEGAECETEQEDKKYDFIPCGGKIDLIPGAPVGIHSPNWPAKYSTNQMCMWWIITADNYAVQLNMTSFDVEEGDETGCYDYLEIRNDVCEDSAKAVDNLRFCGTVLDPGDESYPYSITSAGPDMVLKFYADDSEVRRGFTGVLHAVPTA